MAASLSESVLQRSSCQSSNHSRGLCDHCLLTSSIHTLFLDATEHTDLMPRPTEDLNAMMVLIGICLEPVSMYSFLAIQQIESMCHGHGLELDAMRHKDVWDINCYLERHSRLTVCQFSSMSFASFPLWLYRDGARKGNRSRTSLLRVDELHVLKHLNHEFLVLMEPKCNTGDKTTGWVQVLAGPFLTRNYSAPLSLGFFICQTELTTSWRSVVQLGFIRHGKG